MTISASVTSPFCKRDFASASATSGGAASAWLAAFPIGAEDEPEGIWLPEHWLCFEGAVPVRATATGARTYITAKIRTAKCPQMYAFDARWDRLVGIPRDASMRRSSRCRFPDTSNRAFTPADTRIGLNYKTPALSKAHGNACPHGTVNTVQDFQIKGVRGVIPHSRVNSASDFSTFRSRTLWPVGLNPRASDHSAGPD